MGKYREVIIRATAREQRYSKSKNRKRIESLGSNCDYLRDARFFIGKSMVKVEDGITPRSGWYSFEFDSDREALNKKNGWTNKDRYLLHNPKFR